MNGRSLTEFKKCIHTMSNDILRDCLKVYDETLASNAGHTAEDLKNVREKKLLAERELSTRRE